jgi:acetyl esterase/lipase
LTRQSDEEENMFRKHFLAICILAGAGGAALLPPLASAQLSEPAAWSTQVRNRYRIVTDITYVTANNYDVKLDVYTPQQGSGPHPTVLYFHGGGWVRGSRQSNVLTFLPYLEMGWAVVNVGYRLGPVSLAPAAVEDGLCALRWVIRNARDYGFDTSKIVLTGNSAGGHLALTTGMIPPSEGLDRQCPGNEDLKVAAIVDWYGIADVAELLDGPNQKSYAVEWLASLPNRREIAERVSPLKYVRAGLPPVIMIQGDADPTVPYSHSTRLRDALTEAGVRNELVTVPGGKHGGFSGPEMVRIYGRIQEFLRAAGITPVQSSALR